MIHVEQIHFGLREAVILLILTCPPLPASLVIPVSFYASVLLCLSNNTLETF